MKITIKELKSSWILQPLFDSLVNSKKSKGYWMRHFLNRISAHINNFEKIQAFQYPARSYLEKLKRDVKRVSKIETHFYHKNLLEVELKIGRFYLREFDKRTDEKCYLDLIFWDMADALSGLDHKKKMEILTDLYIFVMRSPQKCNNWKNLNPTRHKDFCDVVRKRVERINERFESELATKKYQDFEKTRIGLLKKQIKGLKEAKKIDPLLSIENNLEDHVRNGYITSRLKEMYLESREKYEYFNLAELPRICKELKIPFNAAFLTAIENDLEFLQAFRPKN